MLWRVIRTPWRPSYLRPQRFATENLEIAWQRGESIRRQHTASAESKNEIETAHESDHEATVNAETAHEFDSLIEEDDNEPVLEYYQGSHIEPWAFYSPIPIPHQTTSDEPPSTSPRSFLTYPYTEKRRLDNPDYPPKVRHIKLLRHGKAYPDSVYDDPILVDGLIRSIRKQKNVAFARVADGSTLDSIQAVFPDPALAKGITNGAFVELAGKWVRSQGAGQKNELQVERVVSIGEGDTADNPIQKKATTPEFLRSIPHLRMRTAFQSLLTRTRSHLTSSIHSYFLDTHRTRHPVYQVHPPLITSSDCEGAGEVFTLTPKSAQSAPTNSDEVHGKDWLYFRDSKYLTVSSQLHLEAFSAELGDVYAFSPTFRAEESDTPRHLAEFYMLETEYRTIGFQKLLSQLARLLKHITTSLRDHQTGQELVKYYADHKRQTPNDKDIDLEQRWLKINGDWHVIDYTSAIELLRNANDAQSGKLFTHAPVWEHGLQLEHERWLTDVFANHRPLFVTHYPKSVKPFYMLSANWGESKADTNADSVSDPRETVACFDLLFPYGYCEVAGGSLREHRLPDLIANMREKGLIKQVEMNIAANSYPYLRPDESLGNLKWYADLRRFGSSPHGGYGLGFDRLLAYLTGVPNVRDVVAFPRVWGRADC